MASPAGAETSEAPTRLPEALIDAAIHWTVRMRHGTPSNAERQSFEQWLEAAPLHRLAWQRVGELQRFGPEGQPLPVRLARDTLQAAQALRKRAQIGRRRRTALRLLSLTGLALTTGWLVHEHTPWQRLLADASTSVGQQRTLRLDDGSVLVLNTDTAVRIDLSATQRLVTLLRGEMLVTTGADAEHVNHPGEGQAGRRPFRVQTPFGRMEALGTRFSVRLFDRHASIRVQEGAVRLDPRGRGASEVVSAGHGRWLLTDEVRPTAGIEFGADDWSQGIVAARNIPLADLLAELERYRVGRVVCAAQIADLRISGVFHIKDTDKVLRFLAQTQPVTINYRTGFWVSVEPG